MMQKKKFLPSTEKLECLTVFKIYKFDIGGKNPLTAEQKGKNLMLFSVFFLNIYSRKR